MIGLSFEPICVLELKSVGQILKPITDLVKNWKTNRITYDTQLKTALSTHCKLACEIFLTKSYLAGLCTSQRLSYDYRENKTNK